MLIGGADDGPSHLVNERSFKVKSTRKKKRAGGAGSKSVEEPADMEKALKQGAGGTRSLDLPDYKRVDDWHKSNNNATGDGESDDEVPPTMITLNIAGNRYQTFVETLEKFPRSLLGSPSKRAPFLNPATGEFFFDRHRGSFESILYFYQSEGYLRRPSSVPVDVFFEELLFFELGEEVIEKFWECEGYKKPEEPILPTNPLQRKVFLFMEHPDSSRAARVCAFFSIFVIALSTMSFCFETLPMAKDNISDADATDLLLEDRSVVGNETDGVTPASSRASFSNPFFVIEVFCISWFTLEFIARFASCPNKFTFIRSFLNWVDFIAIAPFFINLAVRSEKSSAMSFAVLRVVRLVRVFRIFKLSRHSRGLQILGMTFKASVREFCLLIFFLVIVVILFSSAVYFAESGQKGTQFTSIPTGFWYAIVTMTTIGYGDLVPKGPLGKMVGSVCAIVGVLVIALPVPVIVENFKHFYRQENKLAKVHYLKNAGAKGSKDGKGPNTLRGQGDSFSNLSVDS